MPIQFHCGGCQYLLQVPDDAAGKKARCPRCQNVADVPLASTASPESPRENDPSSGMSTRPSDDDPYRLAPEAVSPAPPWATSKPLGPLPTKPASSSNPYQSPAYSYQEPQFGVNVGGDKQPLRPTQIVLDDVFYVTWKIFQQNMGILIGVALVALLFSIATSAAAEGVKRSARDKDVGELMARGVDVATWPIMTFLEIGMAIVYLKVARGQPVEFAEMFSGGKYLLRSLGGDILWGIAVVLAMCALIVPGIFVALMLWPYYLFIIDRDQGVFESFSSAQQFTEGNKMTMFVVFLANMGIVLAGCLTFIIGLVFAVPFVSLMVIVCYLMMTGQLSRSAFMASGRHRA